MIFIGGNKQQGQQERRVVFNSVEFERSEFGEGEEEGR